MLKYTLFYVFFICAVYMPAISTASTAQNAEPLRTVIDMRGKEITFPATLTRIATIDDGFIEGVMTHLKVIDKVNVIGSWSMKRDYKYTVVGADEKKYEYAGLNTMKFLHPWLDDLLCINSPQGNALNYEALAAANPQLLILRIGDCTVGGKDKEATAKTINMIESLGIPLVVLYAPANNAHSGLLSMKQETSIIGAIFGLQKEAEAFANKLADIETLIHKRTQHIAESDKKRVLYFGLNTHVRKSSGAGVTCGVNTYESYIIENIVHARNVFEGNGTFVPISAEHIYALDPDIIILPTYNGYHPPKELYEAAAYTQLQDLRAIQNRHIYAMPWTPMNCARRVEYPLDMLIIAKATYPELFEDINVYDFALQFYQDAYHVDENTAKGLRSTQLLDWMQEIGF